MATHMRWPRAGRFPLPGIAVAISAFAVSSCGGSEGAPARPALPTAVVASASGAFTLTTFPGDARAGLRFADFVTRGIVVVENRGRRPGRFAVRQRIAYEEPAAGPERASTKVDLRVLDVTERGPPREVYAGAVAGLKSVAVGRIAAGASRRFSFKLTPRDPLRSSSLDLSYRWVPAGASARAPDGSDSDSAPGAPPDGDRPKLRLRLQVPPKQRVLDTRRIRVFARCNRSCDVSARATLRAGSRKPVRLGTKVAGGASGKRRTRIELRLGPKEFPVVRRALTEGPPVAVRLRVRARAPDGAPASKTERIRLKPASGG